MRKLAASTLLTGLAVIVTAPALVIASAGPSAAAVRADFYNPAPRVPRLPNGIPAPLATPAGPASIVGSLDQLTPIERARMVGNVVPQGVASGRIPATGAVSSLGKVVSGVSKGFAGFSGLQIGWGIGSFTASLMGYDSDAALQELLGHKPAVDTSGGYIVNADVPSSSDGWVPDSTKYPVQFQLTDGSVFAIQGVPLNAAYLDQSSQMSFSWVMFHGPRGGTRQQVFVDVACRTASNPMGSQLYAQGDSSYYPGDAQSNGQSQSGSSTTGCYSGYVLDHFRFFLDPLNREGGFRWYPKGHPDRPADYEADPVRHWEYRGTCSDGSTILAKSADFQESQSSWPELPAGKCSSGVRVDHAEVWEVTPLHHDLDVLISSWTRSDAAKDWATAYPECTDGSCLLILSRVDPATGSRVSCFSDPEGCTQWFSDPNKATNYECKYGTHVLDITECNAYRSTFDPKLNVDHPYADPKDGDVPSATPTPEPPTSENSRCWPNGWGVFRPDLWVLMPIKCAFIPPDGTFEAGWGRLNVAWCGTAPGVIACAIDDVLGPFTHLGDGIPADDCLGLEVAVPVLWKDHPDMVIHPLSACSSAARAITDFWIPFSSGAVYLGATLVAGRMLSKTIGADDAVPGGD